MAWIAAIGAIGGSVYQSTAAKSAADSAAKRKAKVDAFYSSRNATLTRNILIVVGIGAGMIVLGLIFRRKL